MTEFKDLRPGDRVRFTQTGLPDGVVNAYERVVKDAVRSDPAFGVNVVTNFGTFSTGAYTVELLERPERPEPKFDPVSVEFPKKGKSRLVVLHDDGSGIAFDLVETNPFIGDVYDARWRENGTPAGEWEAGVVDKALSGTPGFE